MAETIRRMIELKGTVYEVLNREVDKLHKEFVYVREELDPDSDSDLVYVYGGKTKNLDTSLKPGFFYKDNDDKLIFVDPSEEDMELYNKDRIEFFGKDAVINAVNREDEFKELDTKIIEDSDKFYMPEIEINDDVFKRVIKHALQEKKISLKACRDRFKNDYDITNMKQALRKDSMLSNAYLHKWAEVLDLHITINVELVSSDGEKIKFDEQMR
jgi:hypothetical protein